MSNSPLNIIKATARSLKIDITDETKMKNNNDSNDDKSNHEKSTDDSDKEEKDNNRTTRCEEPINEFGENDMLLSAAFPYIFMYGTAYGLPSSLPKQIIRHLLL